MDLKKSFNEMSVLSPLLMVYTVVYLSLMVYDFAAREAFELPSGMMVVYIALVGAYAADKEIRRWMGKEDLAKKDVMTKFSISDSTALRLLDELEKKGLIRQEGQMKGAYYSKRKTKCQI